jgi:hypothetical protein
MDNNLNVYTPIFLKEYSAILTNLSDNKMVSRTKCTFTCECGIPTTIQYRIIQIRGAYCRNCCVKYSYNKRVKTVKEKTIHSNPRIYQSLEKISNRDKSEILNLHSNENISFKSIINFKCNCGTIETTLYRNIKIRGAICRNCCNVSSNNKRISTFLEKYGTTHPTNTPHIMEKIKRTNLERYGTEHPAQSPFVNSNTYKSKEYITPSGKKYTIQGYENIALDELIKIYNENDIVIGKSMVPKIKYMFNEKEKIYYPDIYIPSENRIIEVKSTWTYKVQVDKNIIKGKACKDQGYNFEFWIYDIKYNKIIQIC